MLKSILGHNRQLSIFKCAGCLQVHEIPEWCQRNPERFSIFRENLEHRHIAKGCEKAALLRSEKTVQISMYFPRLGKPRRKVESAFERAVRVLGGEPIDISMQRSTA